MVERHRRQITASRVACTTCFKMSKNGRNGRFRYAASKTDSRRIASLETDVEQRTVRKGAAKKLVKLLRRGQKWNLSSLRVTMAGKIKKIRPNFMLVTTASISTLTI